MRFKVGMAYIDYWYWQVLKTNRKKTNQERKRDEKRESALGFLIFCMSCCQLFSIDVLKYTVLGNEKNFHSWIYELFKTLIGKQIFFSSFFLFYFVPSLKMIFNTFQTNSTSSHKALVRIAFNAFHREANHI